METLEQEIVRKGLTAPRVTLQDIEASIVAEYTFTAAQATQGSPQHPSLALLTICVLVTRNGFTFLGKSAVASPENFDAAVGARVARSNALAQMWEPMGYALRERLHVEAAVASASTINTSALRESLALGNTVAVFLGWLSGDIPELHKVEVPRLAASYDRFLARLADERCTQVDKCTGDLDTNALEISDDEHRRRGHVWHSESARWLVPPTGRGDKVKVRLPTTDSSYDPTPPSNPPDPVPEPKL